MRRILVQSPMPDHRQVSPRRREWQFLQNEGANHRKTDRGSPRNDRQPIGSYSMSRMDRNGTRAAFVRVSLIIAL
jgi:hypothetical protein